MWRQTAEGKLAWKQTIPRFATVREHRGLLAVLTKKELSLHRAGTFSLMLQKPVEHFLKEVRRKADDSEQELREEMVTEVLEKAAQNQAREEGGYDPEEEKGRLSIGRK